MKNSIGDAGLKRIARKAQVGYPGGTSPVEEFAHEHYEAQRIQGDLEEMMEHLKEVVDRLAGGRVDADFFDAVNEVTSALGNAENDLGVLVDILESNYGENEDEDEYY